MNKLFKIIKQFRPSDRPLAIEPIQIGHIHQTYKIVFSKKAYVLQQLNTHVFKSPEAIMENIELVGHFLKAKEYPLQVLLPEKTPDGQNLHIDEEGTYWRMFEFVDNSFCFQQVDTEEVANEIAAAFGEYARYLIDFDCSKLHTTIPDFHHTPKRYEQLLLAIESAQTARLKSAARVLDELKERQILLNRFEHLSQFIHVTHNDTKVNNVLLDQDTNLALCIIDLDTLMPGILAYDYGDMIRTMAPSAGENERDLDKVFLRSNMVKVIEEAYLRGIGDAIGEAEKASLKDGAQLIIYEQAVRYATDFLQGDLYYPIHYPTQNLIRAKNQLKLLGALEAV